MTENNCSWFCDIWQTQYIRTQIFLVNCVVVNEYYPSCYFLMYCNSLPDTPAFILDSAIDPSVDIPIVFSCKIEKFSNTVFSALNRSLPCIVQWFQMQHFWKEIYNLIYVKLYIFKVAVLPSSCLNFDLFFGISVVLTLNFTDIFLAIYNATTYFQKISIDIFMTKIFDVL